MIPHMISFFLTVVLLKSKIVDRKSSIENRRSKILFPTSAFLVDPTLDVALLAGADGQGPSRNIVPDRRAGADVCSLADGHRRDQLRVASNERAVFDDRGLLRHTVVIARDRARPDVHLFADR